MHYKIGDKIRVKSKHKILATLDYKNDCETLSKKRKIRFNYDGGMYLLFNREFTIIEVLYKEKDVYRIYDPIYNKYWTLTYQWMDSIFVKKINKLLKL